jgi:hypothetical protein
MPYPEAGLAATRRIEIIPISAAQSAGEKKLTVLEKLGAMKKPTPTLGWLFSADARASDSKSMHLRGIPLRRGWTFLHMQIFLAFFRR